MFECIGSEKVISVYFFVRVFLVGDVSVVFCAVKILFH